MKTTPVMAGPAMISWKRTGVGKRCVGRGIPERACSYVVADPRVMWGSKRGYELGGVLCDPEGCMTRVRASRVSGGGTNHSEIANHMLNKYVKYSSNRM
jgi:hypothetical protein